MPLNVYKMCLTFSQRLIISSRAATGRGILPGNFQEGARVPRKNLMGERQGSSEWKKAAPPPVTLTWHNCAMIKSQNLPKFYIFNWFQPSILVDALPEGGGMLIFFWGRRGKNYDISYFCPYTRKQRLFLNLVYYA